MQQATFTKKHYGKDVEITIDLDNMGLPVIENTDGFLILGIPQKLFMASEKCSKDEAKIAFLTYKALVQKSNIDNLEAKLVEAKETLEEIDESIVEIKTGIPSKKKIEKEKAKLRAQLAALEEL